jgi:hypothetical protein
MEDGMKIRRVSFTVTTDRLEPVLQAIATIAIHIDNLKVDDAAGENPPPSHVRVRRRRTVAEQAANPLRRRKPDQEENRRKGEHIAHTECGQFVLKKMSQLLQATSSEMALIFSRDGRWKPATASPVMSSLRAAGYLSKDDPSPGAPYIFVKMPPHLSEVA